MRSDARFGMLLLALCACSSPGDEGHDGGPDAHVAPTDDAGADAAIAIDAGPHTLRAVGTFGTVVSEPGTGALRVVEQGFDWGEVVCAGTLCATGSFQR